MRIKVFNEYSPLKSVIIGDATHLFFPDRHDIEDESSKPFWLRTLTNVIYPIIKGRKVPQFIARPFQKELLAFEQLLKEHQVSVYRVSPVFPKANESDGLGQMYARDSAMSIGDLFIEGNLNIEMRQKERRGYSRLVEEISKQNKHLVMPQGEMAYLEGGDVLVDYPNIYIGIGKYASNMAGVDWLREQLDDSWQLIPIHLKDDGILHLDCCMTIIGPKTAIICREVLGELPKELDDFNFIDIDRQTRQQMAGNVLVLGDKKIVVQKRHKQLQRHLIAHGFTPIPIQFTWHALLEGAFRCASCPLERV